MAEFRAKLGITVEKLGRVPSESVGVNRRSWHTCTQRRSKVWPEPTTTASEIKVLQTGQMYSGGDGGGGCGGGVVDLEVELR